MSAASLVSILSGLPLPTPPPQKDPEQDKFNRDILNYLRRLNGMFTADNINSGGDIGGDGEGVVGTVDDINWIYISDHPFIGGQHIICQAAPFDFSIDTLTHIASTGAQDLTFDLFINSVQVSGSGDDSPDTTEGVWTPAANTIVGVGDTIDMDVTIGAANGAFAIAFTMKRTRLEKP